ncbi:MAG: hypothetical protein A4E28_02780 [Methanocella sp. PtaU1.Bin125]|nr:MAG: hypothetical protein A4E28_02780 [Methanocella sp. PtaU1.Bin125]
MACYTLPWSEQKMAPSAMAPSMANPDNMIPPYKA